MKEIIISYEKYKDKAYKLIDEMEKQLPVPMHLWEMKNFAQYKKQNKVVIFSDMQKGVAIFMIFIFFCIFIKMVF